MALYDTFQATATRLIDKFGQAATLKQSTIGAYDPATGTASETVTSSTGRVVVTDYDIRQVDGTLIQRGDKRILLSVITGVGAKDVSPVPGDKIVVGNVTYTVVDASPLSPGGTVVMHEIQARR